MTEQQMEAQLAEYQRWLWNLRQKEHAAHGADRGLPGRGYQKIDWLESEIEKIEAKLGIEKPEPLIIPRPPKEEIDRIKAKLGQI